MTAAAIAAADHDDLAARRLDAGECLNVGAVRHDEKDSAVGPLIDDGCAPDVKASL